MILSCIANILWLVLITIAICEQHLLGAPELRIHPSAIDKSVVRSLLCYLPIPEDNDEIGVVYGAQSVRDKNGRALFLLEDGIYIIEQCRFRVGVQCGGRFVEE